MDVITLTCSRPLKILLVENEPMALVVSRRQLGALGYMPDIAMNGQQAIAMAKNSYDFIFMDIGFPDINGVAVAIDIRRGEAEQQKRAFIMALTAHPLKNVRATCLAAGMNGAAAKSMTTKQLQKVIYRHKT